MKERSTRILGLWNMGDSQGFHERKDPRVLKDIIKTAYRNGVDTFDSAFSYKDSDSMLSSAMKAQQPARRNCSTGEDAGYPRQDGKTPWSFTVWQYRIRTGPKS